MKNLYVHIGTPKTGTTAIQAFMLKNRKNLLKNNISYPVMPYKYSYKVPRRNAAFLCGDVFIKGKKSKTAKEARLDEGLKHLGKIFENVDSIVLSDEMLWVYLRNNRKDKILEKVKSFCDEHEIRFSIIVYLRSQDALLYSWWNQRVKSGLCSQSWADFCLEPERYMPLNYWKNLSYISSIVGKENVIVRRYDRNGFHGGNIYSDFLHSIGASMCNQYKTSFKEPNHRLTYNGAYIKRILNKIDGAGHHTEGSKYFLEAIALMEDEKPDAYNSPFLEEERQNFMKQYIKGNRMVAQEFLEEKSSELFPDKKDLKYWSPDNPELYEDTVLLFGTLALQQKNKLEEQANELAKMQARINKLLSRIDTLEQKNRPFGHLRYYGKKLAHRFFQ